MYIMLSKLLTWIFNDPKGGQSKPLLVYALCTTLRMAVCITIAALSSAIAKADNERSNHFADPFIAITKGMPSCPVPQGPMLTPAEVAEEAHWRSQRGVSCHTAGRCRLPNAYLYDQEIIPRVQLAIDSNGNFKGTSVWAMGQRRWVYLQGCVATRAQADELERIVRLIDDVESVVNELMVGTQGKPPYRIR
jgi:BON domain